jgi:hypothetical protein
MRSLVPIALLGSFLLVTGVQAQSLAEHAAAAAGATIGTAAGKPLSTALTNIFGHTDDAAKKAASAKVDTKIPPTRVVEPVPVLPGAPQADVPALAPIGGSSTPSRRGGLAPRPAARQYASVNAAANSAQVAYPQEPPRKEPTAEELATVQVGATEQELVAALGQPESKVTIPDDGHLVEICQYWSKGKQLGTVRLDNGQVVSVEARTQN